MKALKTKLAAVALSTFALGACEDNEVRLQLVQMQPIDTSTCAASLDFTTSLGTGLVDLALAQNYVISPLVVNKLLDVREIKNFSDQDGRIDTHDITLHSAVIEYTALDALEANLPQQVTIPIAASVPVNGEGTVISVEALKPSMIEAMRSADQFVLFDSQNQLRPIRSSVQMILTMRLRGVTLDGKDVESNEYVFPITICNGCRVTFPPEAIDVSTPVPQCVSQVAEDTELAAVSCPAVLGQNSNFVDCVQCQGFAADSVSRQLCQPTVGN